VTNNYIYTYNYSEAVNQKQVVKVEVDLKRYKTYLEVHHRKPRTITRYYSSAKKFIAHAKTINEDTINNYVAYLNKNFSPNTVTSEILGMDKLLDYLQLNHLRISIPDWKPVHRDTITSEQIQKIRKYAKKHMSMLDYLIILFITENDTRNHEITEARWSWIKGNRIYFQDCKTGNTVGILSEELINTLEKWKQRRPKSKRGYEDYILIHTDYSWRGLKLSPNGDKIRNTVKKVTRKVTGRALNPQDLRASVMTAEFNNYVNPKIIQRKARHSSLKTTLKYNHVDDKMYEEYINTGSIFSDNGCQHPSKRPYIKGFPLEETTEEKKPQDLNLKLESDNTEYSFSIISLLESPWFVWWELGDNKLVTFLPYWAFYPSDSPVFSDSHSAGMLRCCKTTTYQMGTGFLNGNDFHLTTSQSPLPSNSDGAFIHDKTPCIACFFTNPSDYKVFTPNWGVDHIKDSAPQTRQGCIYHLGAGDGCNNLHHLSFVISSFFHKNNPAPASLSFNYETEENRTFSSCYGSSFFSSHISCSLPYIKQLIV